MEVCKVLYWQQKTRLQEITINQCIDFMDHQKKNLPQIFLHILCFILEIGHFTFNIFLKIVLQIFFYSFDIFNSVACFFDILWFYIFNCNLHAVLQLSNCLHLCKSLNTSLQKYHRYMHTHADGRLRRCVGSDAVSECPIISTAFLSQHVKIKIDQNPVFCSCSVEPCPAVSNTTMCLYVNASHLNLK